MNLVFCGFLLLVKIIVNVNADFQLEILHNNDMHSRFEETNQLSGTCPKKLKGQCYGGFARVAHVVREARKAAEEGRGLPVLYLNAGDTYTGTSWFTVHRWRIAAEFLNLLLPDAICLGNHEFDDGVKGLVPFIKASKFPIITANVDLSKKPELQATTLKPSVILEFECLGNHEFDDGVKGLVPFIKASKFPIITANIDVSKKPELQATSLKPSVILNVHNHKIGVIGYLTPETQIISQTQDVIFKDEIPTINQEAERLHSQGIKTIIALGHSGFEMDKKIASQVPLIDLVIGGHTNTFLYNGPRPDSEVPEGLYPTPVKQKSGKIVPVVQAYGYTKYLGKLVLTLGEDGQIKGFKGQPLLLNSSIAQEQDVLDLLEKFRPQVEELSKKIVGRSRVILDANNCRKQECNFGNLITDAFVAYKSYFYGGTFWTDTPIAIENGGGIRNSIDTRHLGGNITRADLLGVLPFDNPVSAVSLNGSHLLEMLETSVRSNGETSRGEYLQFSGLKVIYDTRRDKGKRVVSVEVRCATCNVPKYEALDPKKEYRLLVPQFLLNGGDGYTVLKKHAYNIQRQDINDVEMLVWYLNKVNPVFPGIEGRIYNLGNARASRHFVYVQTVQTSGGFKHSFHLFLLVISVIGMYLN